ncbi:MAG: hypoxanthine phosphoribosyltransferase [Hyphomicrobiales bacterium]
MSSDVRQIAGHTIRVLFSEEDIAKRVAEIAAKIANEDLNRLLVIPILKGSFVFAADLLRALHREGLMLEVDFMTLSSYGEGTASSGEVRILRDIEADVKDRAVILIDDILESGRTIAFAKDLIMARGASMVRTCVFLDKPANREVGLDPDYVGVSCPDLFVVGYGMDMGHAFRELPYVGVVETD